MDVRIMRGCNLFVTMAITYRLMYFIGKDFMLKQWLLALIVFFCYSATHGVQAAAVQAAMAANFIAPMREIAGTFEKEKGVDSWRIETSRLGESQGLGIWRAGSVNHREL